jgi:hypothetical protein
MKKLGLVLVLCFSFSAMAETVGIQYASDNDTSEFPTVSPIFKIDFNLAVEGEAYEICIVDITSKKNKEVFSRFKVSVGMEAGVYLADIEQFNESEREYDLVSTSSMGAAFNFMSLNTTLYSSDGYTGHSLTAGSFKAVSLISSTLLGSSSSNIVEVKMDAGKGKTASLDEEANLTISCMNVMQ